MESPFLTAKIDRSGQQLSQGEEVYLITLSSNGKVVAQKTPVSKVAECFVGEASVPRFRAIHEEVVYLDQAANTACIGGVIVNEQGNIQALWASYSSVTKDGKDWSFLRGLPVILILPALDAFLQNKQPEYRSLEVELWPAPLSVARDMGLGDEWCKLLEQRERHVLKIRRIIANSDAQKKLQAGDLLLTIHGKLVNRFIEVEQALNSTDVEKSLPNEEVTVQIFRSGQVLTTNVNTELLSGPSMKACIGTDRLVLWCGAFLHGHHRAVLELGFIPPMDHSSSFPTSPSLATSIPSSCSQNTIPSPPSSKGGVYLSRWWKGSPAHMYGLRAALWITQVNGVDTPDLDKFLEVTKDILDGVFVRLRVVNLQNRIGVITLKTDFHYWKTTVLNWDYFDHKWKWVEFPSPDEVSN